MSALSWPLPGEPADAAELKSCCASLYESPAVRWVVGGQLHPGGEALTLRAAQLAGIGAGSRVLDVACGAGDSALLLAERIGCEVVGVDLGAGSVAAATAAARERGLEERASFLVGDAEALPVQDESFDAVTCECSLCTFPDKHAAVQELRRVLRPGGALALSDVTAAADELPAELRSAMAQVACVGAALPTDGYVALLESAGFELERVERFDAELARMAERADARLRAARIAAPREVEPFRAQLDAGLELLRLGRKAIEAGTLGYALFVARLPAT